LTLFHFIDLLTASVSSVYIITPLKLPTTQNIIMKTQHCPLSLLLVLVVLVATMMAVPAVTAASFVAPVKGQKLHTSNNRPNMIADVAQKTPLLQLQAVAKSADGAAKKKAKKATAKTTTSEAVAAAAPKTAKAPPAETVRKGDFIDRLAIVLADESFTKKQVETAMNAVLQVIQDEVASGKKVMLPGFGSFVAKDRSARKGRNPQTGEEIDIAASRSPGFTPSKAWKDALNGK
jgi:DNA-binding protein HU-beta